MTSAYASLVENLSSEEILEKFPEVIPLQKRPNTRSSEETLGKAQGHEEVNVFQDHDEEQIKLMHENCIVLDWNDNPIGAATKKDCHLMENINKGLLHRAFSVFMFNGKNELLLQQRATEKITFPNLWTNTCCSHPLCVDEELGGNNFLGLKDKIQGVKVASIRKLNHELGIKDKQLGTNGEFHFLNRIHYMAESNGFWGEHEIDYILIYKISKGSSIDVDPNWNEVKDIKWVSQEELKQMFEDSSKLFTPWFKIICENYLFDWWNNLKDLSSFENDETIYRMI
ncbi:hypothetical protein TBLA_0B04230 [Henningerozyma blattae CBS 6284]|uniref:Isopentenyl-diphosphate Delta-isomerase n=1 Tax=Henningerozyma blattae (strain ATCC 34711 / CBS 6284 / DSM 70876 / NBRC 10599 / NRRL Y-10934 / UCD 77-7) TaxID=1071380 RepID=I2GYQ9_HENB6|nr:hypothetical protein TBLA_0B04230 [Tetrapisispora blattae CBS 6284]CCH59261.1 hypothetical protein TBLA_0B04230 [Tetrapisispora blattae CBS 6284]